VDFPAAARAAVLNVQFSFSFLAGLILHFLLSSATFMGEQKEVFSLDSQILATRPSSLVASSFFLRIENCEIKN
jgi:hypothetical protein